MKTISVKSTFLFAVIAVSVLSGQVHGSNEYADHCAVCHGLGGKGDGPLAKYLTAPPSDLTLLNKKNGGAFPETMLYRIIDGRDIVVHHGTREMPVWGSRLLATYGSEKIVNQRIDSILKYLEGIQVD